MPKEATVIERVRLRLKWAARELERGNIDRSKMFINQALEIIEPDNKDEKR